MTGYSLVFEPALPWPWLIAVGLIALPPILYGFWRRAAGVWWRGLSLALLWTMLAGPALVVEQRQPDTDVALIVRDTSPSQSIGNRRAVTDKAVAEIKAKLAVLPGLEVRTVDAGAATTASDAPSLDDGGTRLFGAVADALADVPPARISGVVLATDGQVMDVPPIGSGLAGSKLAGGAPLHVLLSGHRDEGDRRLVIRQAPAFGIVGQSVTATVRVEDLGGPPRERGHYPATARIELRRDGGPPQIFDVPVGQDVNLPLSIEHGGANTVELSVGAGPHELTLDNNRAAFVTQGVRERLHVLLISGSPNAGERSWRNLLKSDPLVDLVHFTILRPPEKQDNTPVAELSLIAFPMRELFEEKLHSFDLVIFDRYQQDGILPITYFANIADYVRDGGALLDAAGPVDNPENSLYASPLGSLLPAAANGQTREAGFRPEVTDLGRRHPVTAGLPDGPPAGGGEPRWGRWFRQIGTDAAHGQVLMTGLGGAPLLLLDHVGKGRVAQLLSDDPWLWTRGFEGGGPQAELMRRLAYWLMKEPDLEEEDLSARVEGSRLVIERRSLDPAPVSVKVEDPDGKTETLPLTPAGDGRAKASLPVTRSGLYRVTDGTHSALAAAGALNPIEFSDLRTTPDRLAPLVAASGGGIAWPAEDPAPRVEAVDPGRVAAGSGWLGFRRSGSYTVTGTRETDLLPPWLALALALATLFLAWRREGR